MRRGREGRVLQLLEDLFPGCPLQMCLKKIWWYSIINAIITCYKKFTSSLSLPELLLEHLFFPLGNPKGAMITHRNIVSNMSAFVKATEVNFADKKNQDLECSSGKESPHASCTTELLKVGWAKQGLLSQSNEALGCNSAEGFKDSTLCSNFVFSFRKSVAALFKLSCITLNCNAMRIVLSVHFKCLVEWWLGLPCPEGLFWSASEPEVHLTNRILHVTAMWVVAELLRSGCLLFKALDVQYCKERMERIQDGNQYYPVA